MKFGGMGIPALQQLADSASVAAACTYIPWLHNFVPGLADVVTTDDPRDLGLGWGGLDTAWRRIWERATDSGAVDGEGRRVEDERSLLVAPVLVDAAPELQPQPHLQRLLSALDAARRYKAEHARTCASFEALLEEDGSWTNPATRWYAQVAAFMLSLGGIGATTWKDAWPTEERMRLTPELLRSGVAFELNLPQESITRAAGRGGRTCTCRHCTSKGLALRLDDPDIVHHYLTRMEESSEMGASAYGSHNAIRDVVCDIARHAGHKVRIRGLGGFLRTADRANIPDIQTRDREGNDTFIDVTMSHLCHGSPHTRNGDPMGSMRGKKKAIYEEGFIMETSVGKKMAAYDDVAEFRGHRMSYHALEYPGRMSTDLVNFLRKAAGEAAVWSRDEFGAGGLDERARHLVSSNFQKFLRWVSCARIRSIATRIVSAAGDEEDKEEEWRRTTEEPVDPDALVREVFSDPLIMHEDAVFGLNA
ncbi:predicted protein [Micromonas commoda]|uniref:Uncharacterized protein n=1 Tax=Micromonas commoda (strain RCC299 / NOUM17 / CCMP2709) TaxID=296587 RepID=C1E413_MICCC|nr:predicted protein [Micromonas commoda]ACO62649.1 predicted protein [Micromonas commoda]|eukprot:XP_002501391.1 predicted protein [Micromonas commoda]